MMLHLYFILFYNLLQREPALLRELKNVKTPTRSFLWPTQIWLPTNWVIRRIFQGQSEVVPTLLSKQATSITTPRSDPSQPVRFRKIRLKGLYFWPCFSKKNLLMLYNTYSINDNRKKHRLCN